MPGGRHSRQGANDGPLFLWELLKTRRPRVRLGPSPVQVLEKTSGLDSSLRWNDESWRFLEVPNMKHGNWRGVRGIYCLGSPPNGVLYGDAVQDARIQVDPIKRLA